MLTAQARQAHGNKEEIRCTCCGLSDWGEHGYTLDHFIADERVLEARRLLADAWSDHAQSLHAVQHAEVDASADYAALLKSFKDARGSALWYDYVGSGLGRGPWVELADGSVKCDMIGGIGVLGVGRGLDLFVRRS